MKDLYLIILMSISFSISSYAESTDSKQETTPQQTEYLSPDQLTDDDYTKLSEFANEYNECLNVRSREELENFNDPRHIVDTAMKKCVPVQDNLYKWMQERRFPPGFAHRYMQKVTNKTVNKLLPQVMMQIAERNAATEQSSN